MENIIDLLTGICVACWLNFLVVVFIAIMYFFKYYDEDLEKKELKRKAKKEKEYEELRAQILYDIEKRERLKEYLDKSNKK